ncbi:MAG: PilZ domain-containing protein [Leptospiraceae bacterium]
MGLLQKDLPVSLMPEKDNPEGNRFQGKLHGVNAKFILIATEEQSGITEGHPVTVEFWIDRSAYRFESKIARILPSGIVAVQKPKVIHKSRIREGNRVFLDMKIHFTPWSDSGRFEAQLLDISETGVRMVGRKQLQKDALISLDFYVKEARARIISQGMVIWSQPTEENDYLFESGVQFTTLSNENRKKLGRYLKQLPTTEGETEQSAFSG